MEAVLLAVWIACSVPAAILLSRAFSRPARSTALGQEPDVAFDEVDDPISVASARMFGHGVDRQERFVVLRYLGLLMTLAEASGRLTLNVVDLVVLGQEHGFSADEVDLSLQWLERVSVLERRADAWSIPGFVPVGAGVPPLEALAVIGKVLARPMAEPAIIEARPVPQGFRRRFGGLVIGMAVILCMALAGLWAGGSSPSSRVVSAARGGPSATPTLSQSARTSTATRPDKTSVPLPVEAAPADNQPVIAGPAAPGTAACPQGAPGVAVEQVVTNVQPASVSDLPDPSVLQTTVSGTLRNPTTASLVVAGVQVELRYTSLPATASPTQTQTQTVSALPAPATLAPESTVFWTVSSKAKGTQAGPATATAHITGWSWAEPALASTCHH